MTRTASPKSRFGRIAKWALILAIIGGFLSLILNQDIGLALIATASSFVGWCLWIWIGVSIFGFFRNLVRGARGR